MVLSLSFSFGPSGLVSSLGGCEGGGGDEVGEAFMDLVGGSRGGMASKKIMEI